MVFPDPNTLLTLYNIIVLQLSAVVLSRKKDVNAAPTAASAVATAARAVSKILLLRIVNHKQSVKDDYGTLDWIRGNGNGLKGRT